MARNMNVKGCRKIEMKKISKESNLHVTFSKRRNGLFKKASELCTLCGAQVALIIFSPGQKVFSFGHPTVDFVLNRFLTRALPQNFSSMQFIEANLSANLCNLNTELTELSELEDAEKTRSVMLNTLRKPTLEKCWWAGPMEAMNLPQLELLKASLEELKSTYNLKADGTQFHFQGSNPGQFLAGSSSRSITLPQQAPPQLSQPPISLANQIFDGNSLMAPLPTGQGLDNIRGFDPIFY
ncbi:hypothetical protein L6164_023557 [Bauhinia variegata]|uniref:Uncharacterized protein n=1 Tax=Bauhinia variegata TaxID=167791 RepID=A0ACB9MJZ1_BAUVA|nr:hypothetical protein L6164_023557 [Bauhinia variegata]